ncbi:hypothetical protein [Streptosporangium subroseum]|nr:hypothetical protein [Streptosporangium subroseum]
MGGVVRAAGSWTTPDQVGGDVEDRGQERGELGTQRRPVDGRFR